MSLCADQAGKSAGLSYSVDTTGEFAKSKAVVMSSSVKRNKSAWQRKHACNHRMQINLRKSGVSHARGQQMNSRITKCNSRLCPP